MKKSLKIIGVMLLAVMLISACAGAVENDNEALNEVQNDTVVEADNSNDDTSFEIEGMIDGMDGDTWMVAGKTVYVNAAILAGVSYQEGDTIQVQGVLNPNESVTATMLQLLTAANLNANESNENDNNANSNANSNADSNANSNTNSNANSNANVNGNANDNNSNDDDD